MLPKQKNLEDRLFISAAELKLMRQLDEDYILRNPLYELACFTPERKPSPLEKDEFMENLKSL